MDTLEKTEPLNYAGRGLAYDYEGTNRNLNVGYATLAERQAANPETPSDPNQLPGTADVSEHDALDGTEGAGYLWNAALGAGLSIRNYGFFLDLARYCTSGPPGFCLPLLHDPASTATVVAYPTKGVLQPDTTSDPYFRGFDMNFADYWREQEWAREFDAYVSGGTCNLPNLELLRLPHDHFGRFSTAIDGVNTVETQVADNDYAVGLVADKVAHSVCSGNTLIFALEDDAQDGPDHVDAHRSLALVAGPYVKQQAVVSTRYTTVSLLRTIEDILGIQPLGLNDGLAQPMGDVFSSKLKPWTYSVIYPSPLSSTNIPPPAAPSRLSKTAQAYTTPLHDAAYWTRMMAGEDFSVEDHLDTARFNRSLWAGLKGEDIPYPTVRDGRDLRHNRKQLLRADAKQQASPSEIESSGSKGSAGR